ncbi:UNVERIFIED_CONTAM: integrase core domain-containing protein, partial [Kocuria sp. CPCC 205295]|uniref:IS3 family transposase n=1 Tax=Kocuria sp. CPCC 205295 TaxID=3073557 RepID=UPI0036D9EB77
MRRAFHEDHRLATSTGNRAIGQVKLSPVRAAVPTEIIYSKRVWPSTTAVEIATLDFVHWWNTARLHERLGYRTPVEVEVAYTDLEVTAPAAP